MPRVVFRDLGVEVEAALDASLLEVCLDEGVEMDAECGGFAACNTCRVRLIQGRLSSKDEIEDPFLERADQRLGCQARLVEDVVLELDPGES